MYRAWSIRSSCCLPNWSSTIVSARTWKARSHAAYQGYSHLSGMEMMSLFSMWCQRSLRGALDASFGGVGAALGQPSIDVVVVELFRPQHTGERLPHDVLLVGVHRSRDDRGVELVGFRLAIVHDGVESAAESPVARLRARSGWGRQPKPQHLRLAGGHRHRIQRRRLGAGAFGIHRLLAAVHDVRVERILHVRSAISSLVEALVVGFVFREEQARRTIGVQVQVAQFGVRSRRSYSGSAPSSTDVATHPGSRTRCCGTRASAARAASPPRDRGSRS